MTSISVQELLKEYLGDKSLTELNEVDFSNKKLTSIEPDVINKCINLESLNISRNRLKSLSGICLPCLKVLNFEDNCVADITFLSDVPTLTSLYFDGNPLNVADRYIAVDQLPNLETLDGKSCTTIRNVIHQFERQLDSEANRIYLSKYRLALESSTDLEDIIQQRRLFTREVINKVPALSGIPPKFHRYKVQNFIDHLFNKLQSPKKNRNEVPSLDSSPISVRKRLCSLQLSTPSPKKIRQQPESESKFFSPCSALRKLNLSSPTSSKKTIPDIHVATPGKKKNLRSRVQEKANDPAPDVRCLNYDPQIFLRCHVPTNDPQDCGTQVWASAFEINPTDESIMSDLVATCGGNIVCFINCRTGHVMKRYKCESPDENLFTLCWTVLETASSKQKTSVLATAGAEKKIYLIHPSQLKCYYIFKAHNKGINCLTFHPIERAWLFSGGDDYRIHLWNIGEISLSDYSQVHKKLMTFESDQAIIQMSFCLKYSCLFASSGKQIAVWDLSQKSNHWTKNANVSLNVPDNCMADDKRGVVDGLIFVSDTCLAFKESLSGKIGLWDVTNLFAGEKLKTKQINIIPITIFLWSDCDSDFSYIGACRDVGIMACGDNAGRLWVYDVEGYKYSKAKKIVNELSLPAVVLPWPNLLFSDKEETLAMRRKIIVNSVSFRPDGDYMVACTNSNLVCIWKKQ